MTPGVTLLQSAQYIARTTPSLQKLTETWGSNASVALYLDRCQVDTPQRVVDEVWRQIIARRSVIHHAVDYGAGDGRFAVGGTFTRYTGFEIDPSRCANVALPRNAKLVTQCAFESTHINADLAIGNPPYVRNQDLPSGWRQKVSTLLEKKTAVSVSGLANAWQYFFLWSLTTTSEAGLSALVIPFEWVSRPSAKAIRAYIRQQQWKVSVYRLLDSTFHRVLTTSSITIVDKGTLTGEWEYFDQQADGTFTRMCSPTGTEAGVLAYATRTKRKLSAKRGLSPGTQKVFTLTEAERARLGLKIGRDVIPCVTTLRPIQGEISLTETLFRKKFRDTGEKCWLIKANGKHSAALEAYIASVPEEKVNTQTCLSRDKWWSFTIPTAPDLLIATGFRGSFPKAVINTCGAVAVGGVAGVYGASQARRRSILQSISQTNLDGSIVPHSNGLRKLEINQLNTVLDTITR